MLSRILVAVSLTLLSLPAYCQTPPATLTKFVPDYILYDRFLARVAWFEQQADEVKAQGKNDQFMRSWIRLHAGLSPREESYLKEMAVSYETRSNDIFTAVKNIFASGVDASKTQQINALIAQRQQIVLENMGRISAAFGPSRFAVLRTFAHTIIQFNNGPGAHPPFIAQSLPPVPSYGVGGTGK